MLVQTDTQPILTQYANGPSLLNSTLTGLSYTDLDLSPGADSWSIRQIVHHIVDGDDIWKTCIKIALGNSDALFSLEWYTVKSQVEWSESWAYSRRSLASCLALYRANRAHIVDLLKHIPGALEKSVLLERKGKEAIRVTVFDVVELHVRHLEEHIASIKSIRQAHGV